MVTDEDPNMLMPSVSSGDGGLLAPDNVVVVPDVSSLRSVLAILEPTEENTGTYECRAESEIGDMALVSVEVVVGEFHVMLLALFYVSAETVNFLLAVSAWVHITLRAQTCNYCM